MRGFQKTGQVEEEVTPCEICGHPSDRVVGGKALCNSHLDAGRTSSDNIKTASEKLATPQK